jgi:2-phospho-L-lactate/phosphoenolpyruvate guanylyltransferase
MAPDVDSEPAAPTWSLVIPVKVLAQAKSRLTGLPGQRRSQYALAMAADTIAAATKAASVGAVLVVTDDPDVGKLAAELGALVLPDAPAAGLNAALIHGAAYSQDHWPERGRAGLAGDLPGVQPGEIAAALAAAARLGAAFVPDAAGTGTTLYAAAPGTGFLPRFGAGSRDAHLAAGAAELGAGENTATFRELVLTGLRRDVDTLADLRLAAVIGLGPRTRALLAADDSIH